VAVATGWRPYDEALAALGLDQVQVPVRVAYIEAAADLTPTARTVADVVQAVDKAGFAAYRSLSVAETVRDVQLEGRGFVVRLPHPEVGISPIFALPWKVAGTRRDAPDGWYRRSSLLGEDDDWFDEQLLQATTGN
jgi:crotonobetainyl-CoA:carnitine CoA-transferase CaiB-like acyl-CoA transferase